MIDPNIASALIGLGSFGVGLLGYRLLTEQGRRSEAIRLRDEERHYQQLVLDVALSKYGDKMAQEHRHLSETVNTVLNTVIEALKQKRMQGD